MALSMILRESGNVVIVDLAGRLWVLERALRQRFNELLDQGRLQFVLNLAGLNYMDSSGLGQLVSIWTSVRNRGGHIVLLRPNERILRLLDITKLNTVFEIFQDEKQALKAVQQNWQASA
ncbi:MAG: STAS domain-containing protein [Acidobacteria bacterium]|nr:STAS domain-containing protein [Acidobacteriota bacterium]